MPTMAGKNTFPSIFSLTGHVFSIFQQKMYGFYPSEIEIKVLILGPTKCLFSCQQYEKK